MNLLLPSCFRTAAGAALLALLVPVAAAQTGEDILRYGQRDAGVSTRMMGMAGAGTGGVADWGATVANPAALALVGGSHITASGDVTYTRSTQEPTFFLDGGQSASTAAPRTARVTRFSPGHAAYVARLPTRQGAFVVGIGAHRMTALDRRLFADHGSLPAAPRSRSELYESGYTGEVSGVAAVEVVPNLYVGASFNAIVGDYSFSELYVVDGIISSSQALDATLRGFNLRGGLVSEVVPGLRLGLSFESPSWIHAEESFVGWTGPRESFSYTAQTPWRFSGGAAYRVLDVLLSVDLSFADWSAARLRPSRTFAEQNVDIERTYRETIDFRVGAEYDFGLGAVRAGYGFAQDPLRDDPDIGVDRLRHTVASGLSFYVRRGITLDLGFSYTEFGDQAVVGPGGFGIGAAQRVVREDVGRFRAQAGLQFNL